MVVDNGSVDGSSAFVQKDFPEVRLLALPSNHGFAGGCNAGIRATQSEFVATLNNDAVADPDWLGELVKAMDEHTAPGSCASKMLLMGHPKIIDFAGITLDRAGMALDRLGGESDLDRHEPCDVFGACAGAALYRRSMLEDVGLFDEDFESYWEDVDLSWRAQLRGWRCRYVPTARVLHHHSATLRRLNSPPHLGQGGRDLKAHLLARNKAITLLKNYPSPDIFRYLPLVLFYDLSAVAFQLLRRNPAPLLGRLSCLRTLRQTLRKRSIIQSNRTRPHNHWASSLSPCISPRSLLRHSRHRQELLPRPPGAPPASEAKAWFPMEARPIALARLPISLGLLWGLAGVLFLGDLYSIVRRWMQGRSTEAHDALLAPRLDGVSIVIPSWNGRDLLEPCLRSLRAAARKWGKAVETIVVDNGSTDDTVRFLMEEFPEVKVLALEHNEGFGEGCNRGVREASSDIIILLNNDMVVDEDFLSPLIDPFVDPGLFAVTAQIFFRDPLRRREETGNTHGRFKWGALVVSHDPVPARPLSPVLYPGGGSSAYRRDRFLGLGGFSPLYRPFYVEDMDLGYRAWRRGWPSLLAPGSKVFHEHRGTVSRVSSPEFVERVIARNRLLFFCANCHDWRLLFQHLVFLAAQGFLAAWRGRRSNLPLWRTLREAPRFLPQRAEAWARAELSDAQVLQVSRSAHALHETLLSPLPVVRGDPLKILFLTPYLPYPPAHGGAVRMLNLIRQLSERHHVYLLSFLDEEHEQAGVQELRSYCREVTTILRRPKVRLLDHLGLAPRYVRHFASPAMRMALNRMIEEHDIDVLQVEYTQLATYALKSRWRVNLLTEHDLSYVAAYRFFRHQRDPLAKAAYFMSWLKTLHFELRACRRFDAVLTVTERDRQELQSLLPRLQIRSEAPTGVDTQFFSPNGHLPSGAQLLFVGYLRHSPNVDALRFFVDEVFPLIRQQLPQAKLTIVGKDAPPEIAMLAEDRSIDLTGFVEDVRPYYSNHSVFVAPIRYGAGVRVKILEAMAAGIPVVTTSLGAEGIQGTAGRHYLVGDTPAAFAQQVVRVLGSPTLAAAIRGEARRLVEERYDWGEIARQLEKIYWELLVAKRQPSEHHPTYRTPPRATNS